MKNKAIIVLLGLLLAFGMLLFTGQLNKNQIPEYRKSSPDKKSAKKSEKPIKKAWVSSAIFSGDAPGQTDVFNVPKEPWRLRWEVDGSPNSASLSLTVFTANGVHEPILERNSIAGPGEGSIIIPRGGNFYILASSYEANWILTVDTR